MTFSRRSVVVVLLMAVALAVQAAYAQQSGADSMRSRAIRMKYDAGKVDGLRVIVYMVERDKNIAVDPSRDFKKGDQIKIEFESSFDGYVYFVNVPPSGGSTIIYPDVRGGETDNKIRARQRYVLPHSATFEFVDDEKGIEVIQVIMARQPIPLFEDAIRNSNGELGKTASSAAAELAGAESKRSGIDTSSSAKLLPEGVRARSVRLAPPRAKQESGTVVAVPDAKLKAGEVAVFEIRLRRV
jgi:hypothetical protein